jgi:hypothetical protein
MSQGRNERRTGKRRDKQIKLSAPNTPALPPIFEIFGQVTPDDPALGAMATLGQKEPLKGPWARFRPAKRKASKRSASKKRRAGAGRWPVDLVGGYPGVLILQVWEGAGLQRCGLADRDLVIIGIDGPDEGAPAFASINNKAVIGWYGSLSDGRISITPFVEATPNLTAEAREVQVVCVLKAIARKSVWKSPPRPPE